MSRVVLDASAVLALLYREPGGEAVREHLDGAVLGSVNLAEVLQKIDQRSTSRQVAGEAEEALYAHGVQLHTTFTKENAARAAEIWQVAQHLGLSLGDRCCLALTAGWTDASVITADRVWSELPEHLGIDVRCIR